MVLKGRFIALASVVILVALTSGAAGLSLATSSQTESAAASLRQTVEATFASRSFTMLATETVHYPGAASSENGSYRALYQAPDRYEICWHHGNRYRHELLLQSRWLDCMGIRLAAQADIFSLAAHNPDLTL